MQPGGPASTSEAHRRLLWGPSGGLGLCPGPAALPVAVPAGQGGRHGEQQPGLVRVRGPPAHAQVCDPQIDMSCAAQRALLLRLWRRLGSVCCAAAVNQAQACDLERACLATAERGRVSHCCVLLHRSTERLNQAAAYAVYRSRTADQTSVRPTSDVPAYADSILDSLQSLQASLLGSSTLAMVIAHGASACLPRQRSIKLTPFTLYDLTGGNTPAAPTAAQWGRRGGE